MDKKDIKIINELQHNSRIPINQLAKKVGVSKEVANYRLKNLMKNKIIFEISTVINEQALGYTRYGCLVQLKNVNIEKEKEFISHLLNNEFITYLGPIIGKWNIAFDILAKNKEHLKEIIKEIKLSYEKYVESLVIIDNLEFESFPLKIFGIKEPSKIENKIKNISLDKIDLKILELLSTNARIEYKTIANHIRLSANSIKYRIKNLEKSGVIEGYTISLDVAKLGYEWHNIQVKLISESEEEKLLKFLRAESRVNYFYKHLGNENWDLDIGVIIKNSLELRDFIIKLRENFGNIIKIHDIYAIAEISKGNIAPKGLFKEKP